MDQKVVELLENKGGSYILPFLGSMGMMKNVLREYMDPIGLVGEV